MSNSSCSGWLCYTLKRKLTNRKNPLTLEKVAALYADFSKDANAQIENGNKAAGTRARKASLDIEKAMKEFRKASLEASKK